MKKRTWDEILDRVMWEPNTGCAFYTGHLNNRGYGWIGWREGEWLAHRVFWAHERGRIPEGMEVCHRCDNPACVNLDHLFLGSRSDNTQDMMRKGRHRYITHRGEKNGNHRLTPKEVWMIRQLHAEGMRQRELAKDFGVHHTTIGHIVNREQWKDI